MKTGIELIAEERARQLSEEGFDQLHDDAHDRGELATAGACYAVAAGAQSKFGNVDLTKTPAPSQWPWEREWWKPSNDKMKNLVRAGALISAEIDRLNRSVS